jgi:hypothetical protein
VIRESSDRRRSSPLNSPSSEEALVRPGTSWPLWGAAGLLPLGVGLWAVIEDAPVWNAVWYVPAWYGYLLLVDAAIFARSGRSFVSHRRRELIAMLFWSLPFWFFFEACNLILKNWYYVFGLRSRWASAGMAALAFATVLPACLFHAELLEVFGVWQEKVCRPLRFARGLRRAVGVGGLVCVAAPLLLPRVAFPLIWFAPIGLEVANERLGAPSLIADLQQGRCGRLLRLLAGGLWAGAIWELVNSWARCKWIYTVPGFEGSKLFEMPAAGFLGFPVLAVGAFAFFSFVRTLPAAKAPWRHVAPVVALAFCAMIEAKLERQTVRSRRPLLTELPALEASAAKRLRDAGVQTPERLSRAARQQGIEALSIRTALPSPILARAAGDADLAIHKGMGAPRAVLLEATGVHSVADLAREEPGALSSRLAVLAIERGQDPPQMAEVRVWVRAARASAGRPAR